jgi:hypothetical protein
VNIYFTENPIKAPPVFTKDHQIIGKQGVFFRAGVARRRAIIKMIGIAPRCDRFNEK